MSLHGDLPIEWPTRDGSLSCRLLRLRGFLDLHFPHFGFFHFHVFLLHPGEIDPRDQPVSFSKTSTLGVHATVSGSVKLLNTGHLTDGQNGSSKARSNSAVSFRIKANGSPSRVGTSSLLPNMSHLLFKPPQLASHRQHGNSHALKRWADHNGRRSLQDGVHDVPREKRRTDRIFPRAPRVN